MVPGPGFDDQDWYQALFDYGQATAGDADARNGGAAVAADDDADSELIPRAGAHPTLCPKVISWYLDIAR